MVVKTKANRQAISATREDGKVLLPAEAQGQTARETLTVEERRARGRSIRTMVPRSSHAFWSAAPNRPDPIALLEKQETTRLPDLIPIRHARMRVSPFAFFRGSAIVMAEDLSRTPTTGFQAQLCGDAHVANFGLYASPERNLLFDVNDFDETLRGPWEWDIKRLAASVFIAGRGNGFSVSGCRDATLAAVRSYRLHMADFADMRYLEVWYSRVAADDLLDVIQDKRIRKRAQQQVGKIRQRNNLQAFSRLTELVSGRRIITDDPPLVMRITTDDMEAVLRQVYEEYLNTLRGAQAHLLGRYQITDFARKVVGVGSVGTHCYILLLTGRDTNDPLFLQAKEAAPSVLESYLPKSGFAHHGQRVVVGQELMQAASDIALGWVRGPEGRDFYLRQLRDMKGSAEIENLRPLQLALWAEACGWALARAHARSGDALQIAAYLGTSDAFDRAIATFAEAYADQNERDYKAFIAAIKAGRIVAASAGT
ncbi:MAG TPA: DUF2252 domain-containing protein [Ktedonobacterales bacterium]